MTTNTKKLNFNNSGYYLIGLFIVAILGFWPSYFPKFFDGTGDYNMYFHTHTIFNLGWIFLLIAQPILIQKRNTGLHQMFGKATYVLFPLIIIAILLLIHHRIPFEKNPLPQALFIPFKDVFVLLVAYGIAIWYRKDIDIHARAMIATAIPFLEPALVRFFIWVLPEGGIRPYQLTVAIMDLILVGLIIRERNQKKGRWVFPLILGIYIFIQARIFIGFKIPGWASFVEWFAALPLT